MGPGQVFRPPVAISSQGFLILDDERNEIAEGLRGEHIVQGGCSGGPDFVQKHVDVVSEAQGPFTVSTGTAAV